MIKVKVAPENSHPVDILAAKDFYSRMKAAGVRKTTKEDEQLTKFLRLDAKFPHLMQMKKVVKALEEVAQIEQKKMQEEAAAGEKAKISSSEAEDEVEEEDKPKKKKKGKKKPAANMDLVREAGGFMNDYYAGSSKIKSDSLSSKMAMLMGGGFTALNTIEEEKHETQTSNYFREGGAMAALTESDLGEARQSPGKREEEDYKEDNEQDESDDYEF